MVAFWFHIKKCYIFDFIWCFDGASYLKGCCSTTTEFVQGLVSFDSAYFAFRIVPAALLHTVRLARKLQHWFTQCWWDRAESAIPDLPVPNQRLVKNKCSATRYAISRQCLQRFLPE